MSADGSVTVAWAGEDRKFRLAIGQLRELQEAVNRPRVSFGAQPIGPQSLLRLLMEGDAWPDEVREVIKLGLIGAGHPVDQVPGLVRRYVDERPLLESAPVAQAILLAALVGVKDDVVGKKKRKTRRAKTDKTIDSCSPSTTEPAPPWDSSQSTSTECHSGSSPPASTDSTAPTAPTAPTSSLSR